MKTPALIVFTLALVAVQPLRAYEITGAKPISKLEEQQKKAQTEKKLVTVVFRGSDTQCPHCATAAENGLKSVRNSSAVLVINESETHDKAVTDKLPKTIQQALTAKAVGGAWVAFHVFDPSLTKEVASADRNTLETNPKAISEFAKSVREARKELK